MSERDYEIGYGKPPKHTQFRKGQSGCPSGGKKPKKSLSDQLEEILAEKVKVTENGKTVRMPKEEVFLRQFITRAISGNPQAMRAMLDYLQRRQQHPDGAAASSATDDFLVTELIRMLGADKGGGEHAPE